jgi:cephalosporin hydroxylase
MKVLKLNVNEEINKQNNSVLWQKTHEWMFADNMRHYTYHFEWLGFVDATPRVVLGIDIDIRKHNREAIKAHPLSGKIKMLEGSSIDEVIAKQVKEFAKDFTSIMVCLDTNHTYDHVFRELELYANLVSLGNYCIVWDTATEYMPDK